MPFIKFIKTYVFSDDIPHLPELGGSAGGNMATRASSNQPFWQNLHIIIMSVCEKDTTLKERLRLSGQRSCNITKKEECGREQEWNQNRQCSKNQQAEPVPRKRPGKEARANSLESISKFLYL